MQIFERKDLLWLLVNSFTLTKLSIKIVSVEKNIHYDQIANHRQGHSNKLKASDGYYTTTFSTGSNDVQNEYKCVMCYLYCKNPIWWVHVFVQ